MKMIGWDDEFGGGQVGMAWLWGSRGKLAEDHRSSICILTPCIYWDFNIYTLFFIHISIHICWTDKLSIDKSPVTDLIKNFFLEKLFTLFTEYFCLMKSLCYAVNGW